MPPLRVHVLRNHLDTAPQPLDVTWTDLVAELTARPPALVLPPEAGDKKSEAAATIPAWIPASFKDGPARRGNEHVESVNVFVLDFDKQRVTEWNEAREKLTDAGLAFAWHSTRSHRPVDGALSYRMAIPLSRPFTDPGAGRWSAFYVHVLDKYAASIKRTDGKTKDPARLFYLPFQVEGGADFESGYSPGAALDVDAELADMDAKAPPPVALSGLLRSDANTLLLGWEKTGYETVKALLDADPKKPYAEPGGRDQALFAAATWLAPRVYRKCTPADVVIACAKGLNLPGCRHADGRTFLLKLERAWEDAQRLLDSTADPVTQCQLGREGPYTELEIMTYVQEQRVPDRHYLARQLIIQHQANFYVFSNGDYVFAGNKSTGETLIRQKLASADSLGVATKIIDPKTGMPKNVKYAELLDGHRTAVRNVSPSLSIKTSYVDWRSDTLMHCCCPRRLDLIPVEDPEITAWLESWGDETLFDWLATSARLDKATAALYLSGPPKGGKTMLARGLSTIWGGPPTEMESIRENFNDELTENPVILADESLSERFRKDSGLLRRLITAESITLNRKYMTPVKLQGSFRIIIAKNNLNLFGNESMSRDDVDAVAERILYYYVPVRAPYFHPVRLAQHILWLERERCEFAAERSKDRLWVEGRDSELHRHMRISSRDRSFVCQFLMELLLNPMPVKHATRRELDLHRRVAISPRLVYNQWATYLAKERSLTLHQVAQVLGELGTKGADDCGLYEINLEDLKQYAQAHSYPKSIDDLIDEAYARLNASTATASTTTN